MKGAQFGETDFSAANGGVLADEKGEGLLDSTIIST